MRVAVAPRAQIETTIRTGQVFEQIAPVAAVGSVTVLSGLRTDSNYQSATEQLGARSFDGAEAEGTRTTTTIPAGAIGNERPIEIVYERWYSKTLQMIVYSKHTDPRFGEQTYRLDNLRLDEPDRSLFTVPSDFKIVSGPATPFCRRSPRLSRSGFCRPSRSSKFKKTILEEGGARFAQIARLLLVLPDNFQSNKAITSISVPSPAPISPLGALVALAGNFLSAEFCCSRNLTPKQ